MEDVNPLLNLCRMCMGHDVQNVNIFDRYSRPTQQNMSYAGLIKEFYRLNLDNKTQLPSVICQTCMDFLDAVEKYKWKVKRNQDSFQGLLAHSKFAEQDRPQTVAGEIIDDGCLDIDEIIVEEEVDSTAAEEFNPSKQWSKRISYESWEHEKAVLEADMLRLELLVCNECKTPCPSFDSLMEHFQESHGIPGYLYCCAQKFGVHTAHYHAQYHQKKASEEKQPPEAGPSRSAPKVETTCETCGQIFPNHSSLTKHRNAEHPNEPTQLFNCSICSNSYKTNRYLQLHLRTHIPMSERELTHVCEHCGKAFDNKSLLNQHMVIHKQTESVACPHCGQHVFDLQRHIRNLHSGKEPETCPICGYKSMRLKRHIREVHIDNGERFVCEACGKEFKLKKHLMKHAKIHTGFRVPCQFCSHRATTSGNLSVHMKSQHREEWPAWKAQRLTQKKFKATVERS